MVEKFDAKKAGKILNIKNEKVNPFFNKTTGSKTYTSSEQKSTLPNALKNKAEKGYEQALKIEAKAKDAGVKLDKDAMRRLNKIKDRYTQATKKKMILISIKAIKLMQKINKPIRILLVEKQQLLKSKEEMIIVEDKA